MLVSEKAHIFGLLINILDYAVDGSLVHGMFSYLCRILRFFTYIRLGRQRWNRTNVDGLSFFLIWVFHAVLRFYTFRIFRREYSLEEVHTPYWPASVSKRNFWLTGGIMFLIISTTGMYLLQHAPAGGLNTLACRLWNWWAIRGIDIFIP